MLDGVRWSFVNDFLLILDQSSTPALIKHCLHQRLVFSVAILPVRWNDHPLIIRESCFLRICWGHKPRNGMRHSQMSTT